MTNAGSEILAEAREAKQARITKKRKRGKGTSATLIQNPSPFSIFPRAQWVAHNIGEAQNTWAHAEKLCIPSMSHLLDLPVRPRIHRYYRPARAASKIRRSTRNRRIRKRRPHIIRMPRGEGKTHTCKYESLPERTKLTWTP